MARRAIAVASADFARGAVPPAGDMSCMCGMLT
eukprot:CAMPEP_0179052730 /NCGR_PEP_ID=MMETSP0796-20121207/21907_1 /TAXON_ID=73915 /ORGANISM="Pyrodinium bahamense, Strain pbaha01" /LENGTH=32 /DNA_ID= /DNA_START= /DNA_END= /DNA_ORIENTATION=